MENEVRFYVRMIKAAIHGEGTEITPPPIEPFVPRLLIIVTETDLGELVVEEYRDDIEGQLDTILESYDDDMILKENTLVELKNILVV